MGNKVRTIELCVESAEDARLGVGLGVDRIELCRELQCGGLTPSLPEIMDSLEMYPPQGLRILVRQNPTSFILSAGEINGIVDEVTFLRTETFGKEPVGAPPAGFVVGAITDTGNLDPTVLNRFRTAAGDRPLTFHRAFDQVKDQQTALEMLIDAGFESVLTTGGDPSQANPKQLEKLVSWADGRIEILASGGLRSNNVREITAAANVTAVHMRAPGQDGQTSRTEVSNILGALR